MKKSDDIRALIDERQEDIRQLQNELKAALTEESQYNVGDILLTKKGEMKIIAMRLRYDYIVPVAVMRKKDGTWGERESELYSWTLEGAEVVTPAALER